MTFMQNITTKQETTMRVASLISIMQEAIVEANEVSQMQYMHLIAKFFDEEGRPITKELILPSLDEKIPYKKMAIPLFCLVPFSSLKMKELAMEFEAHIAGVTDRESTAQHQMNKDIIKTKAVDDSTKKEDDSQEELLYKQLQTGLDDSDIMELAEKDILINFESTRKNSGRPKVKFNITFIQGEVPEAVMKINDNFINKFITFS